MTTCTLSSRYGKTYHPNTTGFPYLHPRLHLLPTGSQCTYNPNLLPEFARNIILPKSHGTSSAPHLCTGTARYPRALSSSRSKKESVSRESPPSTLLGRACTQQSPPSVGKSIDNQQSGAKYTAMRAMGPRLCFMQGSHNLSSCRASVRYETANAAKR